MKMKVVSASVTHQSVLPGSPRCLLPPSPPTVNPSPNRVSPHLHSVRSSPRLRILCSSSSSPGGTGPGEDDSKAVLDAFFLGKAVAEALTERIESTVGEFLSTIGRLQSEQQKQVQEFQDEVLERARKAKEKAAKEAMEEQQGFVPASTTTENPSTTFSSESYAVTVTSNVNGPVATQGEEAKGEEPVSGVSTEE